MEQNSVNSETKEMLDILRGLNARLTRIEDYLNITPKVVDENEEKSGVSKVKSGKDEELEFKIGQFWFAKLGIFVFLIGCLIANTLPFEGINQIIPSALGFILGIGLIAIGQIGKERIPYLQGYLLGSGFVVIYLAAIRLHFFSADPIIQNPTIILPIIYIISGLLVLTAVKRNSPYLAALGITAFSIVALIGDSPYLIFLTLIVVSITGSYLKIKFGWQILLSFIIGLTYFVHLLWFINNPLMGNELKIISDQPLNLLFILVYSIIYSLSFYLDKNYEENLISGTGIFINTALGYGLFLLVTLLSSPSIEQLFNLIASIIFLVFAIIFFTEKKSRMATFFYAMTGYGALSIAIILQFNKPDYFLWLCWQSIIVISTAVWFRSKFIIVANFFIYLLIFLAFLVMTGTTGGISLSFGIVSLLSARILNWKRDRLELTTEQMRNAYLLTALLIIPYSLYHLFPSGLVAIAWIVVAILYYVLSVLLKSIKYRWMSLATFMLTVLYVFVIGITSSETSYKILSFLVLGAALVILSVIYARNKGRSSSIEEKK